MTANNEKKLGMTSLYYTDAKTKCWIAFEPMENGKIKVILPVNGTSVSISNMEDLLNWFSQAFPNSIDIRHCGEVTKIK